MKINKALILVDRYRKRYCQKPKVSGVLRNDRARFEQACFINWAANEVYDYLDTHRDSDPLMVLEDMRYMANQFACAAKTPKKQFMFAVLYDTVTDIYDTLLSEDY